MRRPLHYAIVDEADAQLVDNGSNPFVIGRDAPLTESSTDRIKLADKVHMPMTCSYPPRPEIAALLSQRCDTHA